MRRNTPDAEDEQHDEQTEAEDVTEEPPAEVVALHLLRQLSYVLLGLLHRRLRHPGLLDEPVDLLVRVDEDVFELGRRPVELFCVFSELVNLFLLFLS